MRKKPQNRRVSEVNNSSDIEKQADEIFAQVQSSFSKGNLEDAIKLLKRLLNQYPEHFNLWDLNLWLGRCYLEIKNFSDAIPCLLEARNELNEDGKNENELCYLQILDNLGTAYWGIADFETALVYLEEGEEHIHYYSQEVWQGDLFHFRTIKGRVYESLQRLEDAISQFKIAKSLLPSDNSQISRLTVINYELGRAHHFLDDQETASEYFGKVEFENLPKEYYREYYFYMARHLCWIKKYSEALNYFHKLEGIGIDNKMGAEIYNIAGRAEFHLGDLKNAKRYLQKSNEFPIYWDWIPESNSKFMEAINSQN